MEARAAEPSAVTHGATPVNVASPPAQDEMLVAKERPTMRTFYGWEILIGEGAGALSALSLLLPDRPLGTVGSTAGFIVATPVYALAGPVAHWSHGDFTKGVVSLGANVAVPLVAGFVGRAARCAPADAADNCEIKGFFTGFSLGMITVPLVDALVLGWENVPVEDVTTTASRARSNGEKARAAMFNFAPGFQVGPRGEMQLGVAGRF